MFQLKILVSADFSQPASAITGDGRRIKLQLYWAVSSDDADDKDCDVENYVPKMTSSSNYICAATMGVNLIQLHSSSLNCREHASLQWTTELNRRKDLSWLHWTTPHWFVPTCSAKYYSVQLHSSSLNCKAHASLHAVHHWIVQKKRLNLTSLNYTTLLCANLQCKIAYCTMVYNSAQQ